MPHRTTDHGRSHQDTTTRFSAVDAFPFRPDPSVLVTAGHIPSPDDDWDWRCVALKPTGEGT